MPEDEDSIAGGEGDAVEVVVPESELTFAGAPARTEGLRLSPAQLTAAATEAVVAS